jgi:hypothetical protein
MVETDFSQVDSIYSKDEGGTDITTINFAEQPKEAFSVNENGSMITIDWTPSEDWVVVRAIESGNPVSDETHDGPRHLLSLDFRPPEKRKGKAIKSMSHLSPLQQIHAINKVEDSATPLEKARLADARAALQEQRKDLHGEIRDLLADSDPAEGQRCLGQGTHIARHVNGEWTSDRRRPDEENQDVPFRLIHAIVQAEVPDVRQLDVKGLLQYTRTNFGSGRG